MTKKRIDKQLMMVHYGRGLALLEVGKSAKEVAEMLEVTPRSVRRWRQQTKHPKRRHIHSPSGRPRKLAAEQEKRLEKALDDGAHAFGYAEDYWTLDRIRQVIWQLFGVRYHRSAVWHVLDRMDWSSQRPQRRALRRDDVAIEQWKEHVFPRIKKVS